MDINLYIIGLMLPFVLTLIAIIAPVRDKYGRYLLAGICAMGGVVGIWLFLGIGSDGDLTQLSGSTTFVVASATQNIASWNVATLLPLIFTLMSFMTAAYRAFQD